MFGVCREYLELDTFEYKTRTFEYKLFFFINRQQNVNFASRREYIKDVSRSGD